MNEDFDLVDTIASCFKNRNYYGADDACDKLRSRLKKLHFYEYVFFNGRDSEEARRLKPCTNDERELIKLDLEDI